MVEKNGFYTDITIGSYSENWRDQSDVLTLHCNAAKSLLDCLTQRLASPEFVPDCCTIFEEFTEHHSGYDYYFRRFNEDGNGKI